MTAEVGQPGQIIDGKYRIVRLLGTGGMGAVYEGENIRIRRRVAIKMLHGSASTQPEVIARFEREAQAAALVGSDHICEVLDLGELADHSRYMVMEYLEGETLAALIKRTGRLSPAQSIPILIQILDALGAAHAAGIIHRDLKPDNVFILPQKGQATNFVKILDFGVSKFSQMGGESMNVTRAGAVVGTPYYMSPEQARGSSAIDQRTDIYAIGVLLYQATTGQVPYQAETFNELLFKIVLEVAPPPQTYVPDLDPEFAAIILRAMAREPDLRFHTCQQFRDALVQFHNTRANRLPAFSLPSFHDDPRPLATQVIAVGAAAGAAPLQQTPPRPIQSPTWSPVVPEAGARPPIQSEGSWDNAPTPMQSAPSWGNASAPMQSGAPWGNTSSPNMPVGPTANTAASWGNASSASNAVAPPAKKPGGAIAGVVALTALLGVGGGIAAFVLLGNGAPAPATRLPNASATATATAPPAETPSASASATATADPTATAAIPPPPDAPPAAEAPTATAGAASATPPPADTSKSTAGRAAGASSGPPSTKGGAGKPAAAAGAKGPAKTAPKPSGSDLGY
jgi:serine/threonine-protein kinase